MKSIRKNNRKSNSGRHNQYVQLVERDDEGKPVLDKNGNTIPIPGKFKLIRHLNTTPKHVYKLLTIINFISRDKTSFR